MTRASRGAVVMAVLGLGACNSLAATAAKDPQTCERDPKCAKHARTFDCTEQCTDDPACVDRCEQVQRETGSSSR